MTADRRIFAHSVKGKSPSDWELLEDHSVNVGARAALFCEAFGAANFGEFLGEMHDFGKLKPRFQARVRGEAVRVSHSGEGARYAVERYAETPYEKWGKLIAFCIAGHHSGLPNGMGSVPGRLQSSLEERLREAEDLELPDWLSLPSLEDHIPLPLQGEVPGQENMYRHQFFTRMLFSALVDADFLETEKFYDGVNGAKSPRGWTGSLSSLRAHLDQHMSELAGEPGGINDIRGEILTHVRKKAELSPGLFTLTVPTGGGKTLASLAFALDHAIRHGLKRVIYVIPYMSIVEQTAAVFRDALKDDDAVLEHHSAFDWDGLKDETQSERIRLAAQNWDRPVVVTTAVQFFESLYANRPSKCRKLHRLAQSVVILDEAQTLPLRLLRPSLAAINELARGYGSSLVLCTATQPAVTRQAGFPADEALDLGPDRELAPDPAGLHKRLRRTEVRHVGPLSDEELTAHMAAQHQILTIVDNRNHARALFEALRDEPGSALLTNAMTPVHRRTVLADIRTRLKPRDGKALAVRLVATSLIEAGVDVDFPVVYRAIHGIDSITQAAGRCNREGSLPGLGQVFVFEPQSEHRPPLDIVTFAEVASRIVPDHEDLLAPEAIRDYSLELYEQFSAQLDHVVGCGTALEGGIMNAIANAGKLDFAFAGIAKAYRIIQDGAVPVVVCGGSFGVPPDLLETLQRIPHAGVIARQLQPYQVQVPEWACKKLLGAGAASFWRQAEFDSQFVMLDNAQLYDDRAGLGFENAEDLGMMVL